MNSELHCFASFCGITFAVLPVVEIQFETNEVTGPRIRREEVETVIEIERVKVRSKQPPSANAQR